MYFLKFAINKFVKTQVGHPVAEVRVTHYGDGAAAADVVYAVEPSQGNQLHGLNFSDASSKMKKKSLLKKPFVFY